MSETTPNANHVSYTASLFMESIIRSPAADLHATTQYEFPPSPPDSSGTGCDRVVSSSAVEGEEKRTAKKSICS
ncbi:hypothetical protein OE88DRAFT_1668885 [Heliocybe sulcata]|uniref:Uncharacterized protein n=1 Tax=Heliocybe sulcata TaxID=5364 RepID=A0A5C3MKD5_9AGAM|nr:hypothetical protein OE88DRAFT_1668885 [Heliocybe sulcata]